MNKDYTTPPTQAVVVPASPIQQPDSALAIVSMVLGVTSLTGPGFIFGIPAIITAIIALKKNENNRGLSITGLVTGCISTVVSLVFCVLLVWAVVWSLNNPPVPHDNSASPSQFKQMFDSART